jgi:hypothetical protein
MIIDCISDLHGHYPKLEGGDLLIVAGDLTARDTLEQHADFTKWLYEQSYRKKIVIAGNQENYLVGLPCNPYLFSTYNSRTGEQIPYAEYLCDSGTEFEGLKIWGSPWCKWFPEVNPKCTAFMLKTEEELAEKWAKIPRDVDILVTHSPSQGVLDEISDGVNVGSSSLIKPMINSGCKLHVFGHIHESYGKFYNPILGITYVNASHVNERYEPVNKPIRVIL